MKIYTKTGDKGTTRLVDGSCVEKHNPWVEAYGTVDELNSYLGLVSATIITEEKKASLEKIQHHLFRAGSLVASGQRMTSDAFLNLPQIDLSHITFLEFEIDEMTSLLPILKNFILPSGSVLISNIHYARTLCRRSERRVSEIYITDKERFQNVLIYLNRLSDYLFTLARWAAVKTECPETKWDKSQ
jgi:cob(I)alamin adenosyltransferase